MVTEDQAAVIEFLGRPSTHGGAPVERIDTHSAVVFLAGPRAWKLKRAVRYDYLDFSTSELRKSACEAEVRLNRRTAPSLYRAVVAVTSAPDGSLALGGSGSPIDWVVEMKRFDQDALFDRLASRGALTLGLMDALGGAVVRFHRTADRRTDHGGGADMQWVVDGNALGFDEFGGGVLDRSEWEWLIADTRAELERVAPLLDRRRDTGFVRQGHGDLHLRNIVLLDGEPTLFDAIEFNDEIACVDVLYDLAFLLMDLWRRALPAHANTVWNRYLGETGDVGGIALTPFFLSCRAAVRAKTSATAASLQKDERRASERQQLARDYLAMAKSLLHPPRPWLIALGGVSGSGKSTLARGLAPCVGAAPGAVILRSDEIRKRACGVAMLDRLGPQGYAPEVSARVYEAMREQAFRIVDGGHSAILDAVYAKGSDRLAIEQVAARARVPFAGIWLDAPDEALLQRVAGRRGDPSDAGAAVVRLQRAQDVGIVGWPSLDASRPADVVLDDATRLLLNRGAITTTRAACEPSRA